MSGEHKGTPYGFFVHDRLESPSSQIRLLRLLHEETDSELSFELSTWDQERVPGYNAISYTWGASGSSKTLFINQKLFYVRENCYYALWQTRLHYPKGYIWIDSICINQQDLEEKGHQVQKMFSIYNGAESTFISVGGHADRSELLVGYFREWEEILAKMDKCPECGGPDHEKANDLRTPWIARCGADYVENANDIMRVFKMRPYWTRLWIVQEIAASGLKMIFCGEDVFSWTMLEHIDTISHDRNSHSFSDVIYRARPGRTVLEVFSSFGNFECKDLHDRLYGLLGLVAWENEVQPAPIVDYNIELSDLLLHMIQYGHGDNISMFMRSFNINVSDPQFQALVTMARNKPLEDYYGNPPPRHFRRLGRDDPHDHSNIIAFCEIVEDLEARMAAPFTKIPPDVLSGSHNSWRENMLDVPPGVIKEIETTAIDLLPFKPIFAGAQVCALACTAARPGDILVAYSVYRPDSFLVLRPHHRDTYEIIGQALSINQHFLCGGHFFHKRDCALVDGEGPPHRYHAAKFETNLVSAENLLLWQQDFVGPQTVDEQAQKARLVTSVALYPGAMARIIDMQ